MDPNVIDPGAFARLLLAILAGTLVLVLMFAVEDPYEEGTP